MKGIIMAGGYGTRLFPLTMSTSKHLLPIYDKPMIYYSLSILFLAKIKEIAIVLNECHKKAYFDILGDGSKFGVNFEYVIQDEPRGIPECFLLCENFIDNNPVCLILGDNIFFGQSFAPILQNMTKIQHGAFLFSYPVNNPKDFGVIVLDDKRNPILIEEKPKNPKSNLALTGLYFYDKNVTKYAKKLSFSSRGELEITDLNNIYLKKNLLKVNELGRGYAWLDTGSASALLDAGNFVKTIEDRQGMKIACLEEIALSNNWISEDQLKEEIKRHKNSSYSKYLKNLLNK